MYSVQIMTISYVCDILVMSCCEKLLTCYWCDDNSHFVLCFTTTLTFIPFYIVATVPWSSMDYPEYPENPKNLEYSSGGFPTSDGRPLLMAH